MGTDIRIYDQKELLATVREMRPVGTHIGGSFFPVDEVESDEVLYDIITEVTGGLAKFRAYDAEAELIGEDIYEQAAISLADIAQKKRYNVSDLRIIREAGQLGLQNSFAGQMAARKKAKVNKDIRKMRNLIDNRLEWMQINALQGAINVTSGKTRFSLDFGIPADQTGQVPSTKWDQTNSTPLDDINGWCDTVENASGVRPTRIIISNAALLWVVKNEDYRTTIGNIGRFMSLREQGIDLIQAQCDIEVIRYNAAYTEKSSSNVITSTRFLDKKKIILLGPDAPGVTLVAPHPHADFQHGIYAWEDTIKDPYKHEVGVGIVAIPLLSKPREVFNATVLT